ncbi:hypothetical protein [Streptomyces cinnamoneus]|uniref:hypothetical protein n=1 Tax=Streptomyces cinnamoneus TaxID=53446 RepID=UPI0037BA5A30
MERLSHAPYPHVKWSYVLATLAFFVTLALGDHQNPVTAALACAAMAMATGAQTYTLLTQRNDHR